MSKQPLRLNPAADFKKKNRLVNVVSPVRFVDGQIRLPASLLASPAHHYHHDSKKSLLSNQQNELHKMDSDFSDEGDEEIKKRRRLESILSKIQQKSRAPELKTGLDEHIGSFFQPDFVASPLYKFDPSASYEQMRVRQDSRG